MRWRPLLLLLPPLLTFLLAGPLPAQAADTPSQRITQTVQEFLGAQTQRYGKQVEIEVGRVPESPRYAECQQWQAALPQGMRAWGRVTVAVSCRAGSTASLFVTARVRVFGGYVVLARPVQGGQELVAADLRLDEGEITAQANDVVLRTEDALGRSTRQALSAGQTLRGVHLRSAPAITAGQTVRVLAQGEGFAVSDEGQALNTAGIGQAVRVRMGSGKVVSGTARADGVVELSAQ